MTTNMLLISDKGVSPLNNRAHIDPSLYNYFVLSYEGNDVTIRDEFDNIVSYKENIKELFVTDMVDYDKKHIIAITESPVKYNHTDNMVYKQYRLFGGSIYDTCHMFIDNKPEYLKIQF